LYAIKVGILLKSLWGGKTKEMVEKKPIYCPVCAKIIGICDHNRMDMIIHILYAWDYINNRKKEIKGLDNTFCNQEVNI
jgi:hypothetical protein